MTTEQAEESAGSKKQPSRDDVASRAALRREVEHLTEDARELWRKVADKVRKPSVGATVAGAAVLAAGAVWGASEAAVAAIAAYAVFRILRKRGRADADESGLEGVETERDRRTSAPLSQI